MCVIHPHHPAGPMSSVWMYIINLPLHFVEVLAEDVMPARRSRPISQTIRQSFKHNTTFLTDNCQKFEVQ